MKRFYAGKLINHYASVQKAVIVSRLEVQPPEGYDFKRIEPYEDGFVARFMKDGRVHFSFIEFPVGATVGMPEIYRWNTDLNSGYTFVEIKRTAHYEGRSLSLVTMPNSAIRLLWKVTGMRVCKAREVIVGEICKMGLETRDFNDPLHHLLMTETRENYIDWYSICYPDGDFEKDYVEVAEIERIEHDGF